MHVSNQPNFGLTPTVLQAWFENLSKVAASKVAASKVVAAPKVVAASKVATPRAAVYRAAPRAAAPKAVVRKRLASVLDDLVTVRSGLMAERDKQVAAYGCCQPDLIAKIRAINLRINTLVYPNWSVDEQRDLAPSDKDLSDAIIGREEDMIAV